MSFRRYSGTVGVLTLGLGLAFGALAQTEPAPAQVIAQPEAVPAEVTQLSDAHGPAQPGDAAAGAGKAAACAACHGVDGNSVDPQYPKLAGQNERYIARQLALYKSGGRENAIMVGFASTLSPQDMRDLGAHFASQTVRAGIADETPIADGPNKDRKFYEVGQALYRGGDAKRGIPACMACHGPTGHGNAGAAYPALAGQHAGYTALALQHFREGKVWGKNETLNTIMGDVARPLTDEEIQALSTYIEGLHPVVDAVATQ
ncbi:c-type cytochrome [Chiayiivirga flava]|uniref:Cytochrome c553 n=1 Tax=Chiayiivirga flava TaxID=659595 RepID=A0A7W8D6N2_9GAMM|nr:c-type cytochrome [Chiayiivirga flava]MBB5208904.1 cytochrome c553 [Chiayiivirga flava]